MTATLIVGSILLGCLLLFTIHLHLRLHRLQQRFSNMLGGDKSLASLEKTLITYFDKLSVTEKHLKQMRTQYELLHAIGARSYQRMGLIRFNPFRDTGGDQSFALCLLDNEDSGIMLTAVHGREGTRVYAKVIDYGQSQGALSAEEKAALTAAVKQPKARLSTKK